MKDLLKKVRGYLFAALMIASLFFSVMAWHFTETATQKKWWVFWEVVGYVSPVIFIGGIWWYTSNRKQW